MIVATRRFLAIVMLLVVAGCGTSTQTASPSPGASTAASAGPASAGPASAFPSSAASASASQAPTTVPTASATAPTAAPSQSACLDLPQTVVPPSDRFVDLKVATGANADRLTFVFGNASLPGPPAPPQGSIEVARPPYTLAGSGEPITMEGEHVIQVRFTGMSITNDVGQPTYDGPDTLTPDGAALQNAVLFDASEGVIGWYVGYDGSGCLRLVQDVNGVTLVFDHG